MHGSTSMEAKKYPIIQRINSINIELKGTEYSMHIQARQVEKLEGTIRVF